MVESSHGETVQLPASSPPRFLIEREDLSRCKFKSCCRTGSHQKMLTSCPFCHASIPSTELEWHANNHFADDQLERDLELAMQISLEPPSPDIMVATALQDKRTNFTKSSAAELRSFPCNSDSDHNATSSRDAFDLEISMLVGLQMKSTFYNVEGGLMALLRRCLELENGNTVSIISGHTDHYQTNESEDVGWGCGWRNIQMLSSHLLAQRPAARDVLFGGSGYVPDIPSLQRWLEISWKRGFDTYGSNFFYRKVYGTKKWIGTTECATLFRSFGLRAKVVDFDSVNSKKQLNNGNSKCKGLIKEVYGPMDKFLKRTKDDDLQAGPSSSGNYLTENCCDYQSKKKRNICGPQVLVDWVWKYFSSEFKSSFGSAKSVLISEKTPLYFQHDGHSRTIVGIQMSKGKCASEQHYSLLVLDPAHRTAALEKFLIDNNSWQKLIKRGAHTLRKPQYQLCYVDPGIASEEEMEQLKIIDSILIEI